MDKEELFKYIDNPDLLNDKTSDALEKLLFQYSGFQTIRLLLAKNWYAVNRSRFEEDLEKTSAFSADRRRLFYLIKNEKYDCFFPKKETISSSERTQMLLESYLEGISKELEESEKIELDIVSNDYLAYLNNQKEEKCVSIEGERKEDENKLKHHDIIDCFLEKVEANEINITSQNQLPDSLQSINNEEKNDGFLTETLAKIYIKQKKYEQALTIIRRLSLNYPKKSVYFADQIRFLEHLIINEKNKKI